MGKKWVQEGSGANILIVGGTGAIEETALVLQADLGGSNTVTIANSGVPEDLTGYTQIYDVRANNQPVFTVAEQNRYLAFLNAAPGNALFLMGENTQCCEARNNAIGAFVALAGGGTIPTLTQSSWNSETVNPPFTGPNPISTITYAECGLATSPGTGAFATQEPFVAEVKLPEPNARMHASDSQAPQVGGCAIYWGLGTLANAPLGALAVVYDINFIFTAPTEGAVNEVPFRYNLEAFVSAPTTPPTVTSVSPSSGSVSGGTAVTISGTGFKRSTGVSIGGASATNFNVSSETTITATTPPGKLGPASVVVSDPEGINGANSLFTYVNATSQFQFRILCQSPISLQIVPDVSVTASSTAAVWGNMPGGNWSATTATPWLTLNTTNGTLPGRISVTANATGLAAGSYQGTIIVTGPSLTGGPALTVNVPVMLTVLPPESIATSATALPGDIFGYTAGSGTGYDIQIGPSGLPFSIQTSSSSSSWLSVNPTSGTGPATVHVVINPSNGTYGTYQDSLVITSLGAPNSPLSIPVEMTISGLIMRLPQQVSTATNAGPDHTVAPNEMVSLYLTDFSCPVQPVVSINGTPVSWSS